MYDTIYTYKHKIMVILGIVYILLFLLYLSKAFSNIFKCSSKLDLRAAYDTLPYGCMMFYLIIFLLSDIFDYFQPKFLATYLIVFFV